MSLPDYRESERKCHVLLQELAKTETVRIAAQEVSSYRALVVYNELLFKTDQKTSLHVFTLPDLNLCDWRAGFQRREGRREGRKEGGREGGREGWS